MTEEHFIKAFESNRFSFTFVDGLNEELTVIKVGIVASFQIADAYTPSGRQRVVNAVKIFCDHHGEKLKWGYIGAEALKSHDYSVQNLKLSLDYLNDDGFVKALAFRWSSAIGYDQVADYMIDGYSSAGWFEQVHGTVTTLRFYLPIDEILENRKPQLEALLVEMLDALNPLHAAAGLGIQHTYQWEDFQHIEYDVAMAFQGIDVVRPRGNPSWRSGYSNLNWYTYINSAWMKKLGSHDSLLAQLDDLRIDIQVCTNGVLLRAGEWPALWKADSDPRPALYVKVNEAIKPLRVEDIGSLHYGSIAGEPRMNQLISNAWLRRFDMPPGKDQPNTPAQYKRLSKAEIERFNKDKDILDSFISSVPGKPYKP